MIEHWSQFQPNTRPLCVLNMIINKHTYIFNIIVDAQNVSVLIYKLYLRVVALIQIPLRTDPVTGYRICAWHGARVAVVIVIVSTILYFIIPTWNRQLYTVARRRTSDTDKLRSRDLYRSFAVRLFPFRFDPLSARNNHRQWQSISTQVFNPFAKSTPRMTKDKHFFFKTDFFLNTTKIDECFFLISINSSWKSQTRVIGIDHVWWYARLKHGNRFVGSGFT